MIACKDMFTCTTPLLNLSRVWMDPLCDELKKCKNHLFYLADLYSEFNELQRHLQGKEVTKF